ncbi:MAG TPA: PrpF domain-containing protein [Pseudonocardiaceae bacterium]
MPQRWIHAVFMRGGARKGLFFHRWAMPFPGPQRDQLLMEVMGGPCAPGTQPDGMGSLCPHGANVALVGPGQRSDVDVEYLLAEVRPEQGEIRYGLECADLASAVAPFAVDERICSVTDGEVTIRMLNSETGQRLNCRFEVRNGVTETSGDFTIPGVSGGGAPVHVEFLNPVSRLTGSALPTGLPKQKVNTHHWRGIPISVVDVGGPVVFVSARDLGLRGNEQPAELNGRPDILHRLELIRRRAAVCIGLAATEDTVPEDSPSVVVAAAPQPFHALGGQLVHADEHDIAVRLFSHGRVQPTLPTNVLLCAAVAPHIPGTVTAELLQRPLGTRLRLATAGGVLTTTAEVSPDDGWQVRTAGLYRTARRLMTGLVSVPRPLPASTTTTTTESTLPEPRDRGAAEQLSGISTCTFGPQQQQEEVAIRV